MNERERIIPAVIGIAMIVAGVFIFINAENTFFAIAKILGWVTLGSGLLFIYSYLRTPGISSIVGKLKLVTGAGLSISLIISIAMILGGISYIMVFLGNTR